MKLGLISDVHGECAGLERALRLLDHLGCDQIVCCGDLVDKGPEPDCVIRLMQERRIPCVQGNHDLAAPSNQRWLRENAIPNHPSLLSDASMAYLLTLPVRLHREVNGVRVFLGHGAPWSSARYVYHNMDEETYERVLREAAADVVVLGHTHQPMRIQRAEGLILNPGSVCGQHTGGSRTCATLTLPERAFEVYSLETGRPTINRTTIYG